MRLNLLESVLLVGGTFAAAVPAMNPLNETPAVGGGTKLTDIEITVYFHILSSKLPKSANTEAHCDRNDSFISISGMQVLGVRVHSTVEMHSHGQRFRRGVYSYFEAILTNGNPHDRFEGLHTMQE